MGRQQTEMEGNINSGVSTLSQAGMPSSPSLGFSQALRKGTRGIFLYWRGVLYQPPSGIGSVSGRHCKVR